MSRAYHRGRVRYHYIIADYLCEYMGGELEAGSDVTDVRLVPLDEIQDLGLTQKTLEVVGKAREILRNGEKPKLGGIHG